MKIPNPNIYELNYNQAGTLLTPPNKRQPVWLAFKILLYSAEKKKQK